MAALRDAEMNSSCAIDMVMISMLHSHCSMSFALLSPFRIPPANVSI